MTTSGLSSRCLGSEISGPASTKVLRATGAVRTARLLEPCLAPHPPRRPLRHRDHRPHTGAREDRAVQAAGHGRGPLEGGGSCNPPSTRSPAASQLCSSNCATSAEPGSNAPPTFSRSSTTPVPPTATYTLKCDEPVNKFPKNTKKVGQSNPVMPPLRASSSPHVTQWSSSSTRPRPPTSELLPDSTATGGLGEPSPACRRRTASVVKNRLAIEAGFCSTERVTLAGFTQCPGRSPAADRSAPPQHRSWR